MSSVQEEIRKENSQMEENTKVKTDCGDKHGNRMYRVPNPDSEARKNPGRCSSDARKIPERSLKNTKSPPEASSLQLRFPATCLGRPHNKVVSQPPESKSPTIRQTHNSPHPLRQPSPPYREHQKQQKAAQNSLSLVSHHPSGKHSHHPPYFPKTRLDKAAYSAHSNKTLILDKTTQGDSENRDEL